MSKIIYFSEDLSHQWLSDFRKIYWPTHEKIMTEVLTINIRKHGRAPCCGIEHREMFLCLQPCFFLMSHVMLVRNK